MAISSRSSVQNFDNWCFWIRKTKCIAEFNKKQNSDNFIDKICLQAKDLSEPKFFG